MSKEVIAWNPPVKWVKDKIEEAGSTIGSVHFIKRTDGELRKMSYRLHVKYPSVAAIPKRDKCVIGVNYAVVMEVKEMEICTCGLERRVCNAGPFTKVKIPVPVKKMPKDRKVINDRKVIDEDNNQMTVLDANKVVRDSEGKILGRGAWRTIPLENVVRIKNKGTTYIINRFE